MPVIMENRRLVDAAVTLPALLSRRDILILKLFRGGRQLSGRISGSATANGPSIIHQSFGACISSHHRGSLEKKDGLSPPLSLVTFCVCQARAERLASFCLSQRDIGSISSV